MALSSGRDLPSVQAVPVPHEYPARTDRAVRSLRAHRNFSVVQFTPRGVDLLALRLNDGLGLIGTGLRVIATLKYPVNTAASRARTLSLESLVVLTHTSEPNGRRSE